MPLAASMQHEQCSQQMVLSALTYLAEMPVGASQLPPEQLALPVLMNVLPLHLVKFGGHDQGCCSVSWHCCSCLT